MSAEGYESSGQYLAGLVSALDAAHRLCDVKARATAAALEVFARPLSRAWWSQQVSLEVTDAILAAGGPELLREVARRAAFGAMWKLVEPVVRMLTGLFRPRPQTLLARLGTLSQAGVRHVHFKWEPRGERAGVMVLEFPSAVPATLAHYWEPVFELVFEATHTPGQCETRHLGARFEFSLTWT